LLRRKGRSSHPPIGKEKKRPWTLRRHPDERRRWSKQARAEERGEADLQSPKKRDPPLKKKGACRPEEKRQ